MPRVVPSQIVAVIDDLLPSAKDPPAEGIRLGTEYSPHLHGILALTRDLPPELIQVGGSDHSDLVLGMAGLEYMIRTWEARGQVDVQQKVRGSHPLVLIRRALAKCSDESPAPGTADLLFISDPMLRNSIRLDISEASSALHSGQWKAATVLAGSAVEALLLWGLQNRVTTQQVAAVLSTLGNSKKPSNSDPEKWTLDEYIEVSAALKLIKIETVAQAKLARHFRNLIHPGRAARTGLSCDRASALSALAAVEHVARDLK